jgi:hypothetical protein
MWEGKETLETIGETTDMLYPWLGRLPSYKQCVAVNFNHKGNFISKLCELPRGKTVPISFSYSETFLFIIHVNFLENILTAIFLSCVE